jgi:poly-gamma-glutamate capsule biosynthesis protein CapA/YwtB (metallophosphatase superfamily)
MPFWHKLIIYVAVLASSPHPASAGEVVINAVGDIMLAGSGAATYQRLGYDYPFAATVAELRKGDIAVGNLEAPITQGGSEFTGKKYRYRCGPRTAAALKNAGFSVVTLANNHIMDYGSQALEETRRHLDRAGINYTGAGESLAAARTGAVITVREKKVAFLAYSFTFPADFYAAADRPGTAPGFAGYYREDIARARASVDYVVVSFHWGTENSSVTNPYQVTVAHRAIDAGADLVLGHHPHVLQGIEHYKKGVILYSLGNFAFGTAGRSAGRSVIARVTMDDGVKAVELVPLNVLNREVRFQPRVLAGTKGQEVIDHLTSISRRWGTVITAAAGRFLIEMEQERILARQF